MADITYGTLGTYGDLGTYAMTSTSSDSTTSCPWSSTTVTNLIQAVASLTTKVDNLATELAKITARMPSYGTLVTTDDASTFANAVWTSSVTGVGRTLTDAVSITSGSAAAIAGNMNTSAIGAAITGVTATVNESDLATQLLAGDNNLATKLGTSLGSNTTFATAVGQNIDASNIAVPTPTVQWSTDDKTALVSAILDTTAGSHITTGTIGAKISATGDGGTVDTDEIASAVWTYGDGTTTTRSLTSFSGITKSDVTSAVWGDSTENTPKTFTIAQSEIAQAVWEYGNPATGETRTVNREVTVIPDVTINETQVGTLATASSITSIPANVWEYSARALTANTLNNNKSLALSDQVQVTLNSDNISLTIPTASDIAQEVWNYGKSDNVIDTERSLSTSTLIPPCGKDSATYMLGSLEIGKGTLDQSVWNYGQDIDVEVLSNRSINTTSLFKRDGTWTEVIASSLKGGGTVDKVVWGLSSDDTTKSRELTSNKLSSGTLATTSDVSSVMESVESLESSVAKEVSLNSISTELTKVLGVLCHWKEENGNVIVYDNNKSTLMTIPIVKDKYGDIVKMGEMP